MAEIFDDLSVFESWFNAKDMDMDKDESERILMQEKQDNILSTLHQVGIELAAFECYAKG